MSEHLTCPRCRGTVIVAETPSMNVTCPFCQQFLMGVDARTGATWRPRKPWPSWVVWLGWCLVLLALAGFCVSFLAEDKSRYVAMRTGLSFGLSPFWAGSLNPLFFVGLPLGALLVVLARQDARVRA